VAELHPFWDLGTGCPYRATTHRLNLVSRWTPCLARLGSLEAARSTPCNVTRPSGEMSTFLKCQPTCSSACLDFIGSTASCMARGRSRAGSMWLPEPDNLARSAAPGAEQVFEVAGSRRLQLQRLALMRLSSRWEEALPLPRGRCPAIELAMREGPLAPIRGMLGTERFWSWIAFLSAGPAQVAVSSPTNSEPASSWVFEARHINARQRRRGPWRGARGQGRLTRRQIVALPLAGA